jgi:histidinol-phosphate phosphatase family protein
MTADPTQTAVVGGVRGGGILGPLACPLGLGLLRLSVEGRPPEADAVALIRLALDAGIRVLDTADVYGLGASDLHYGERLVRTALDGWNGPRAEVRVLTKAGLARPKGKWVPDGRPEALRKAVDGSLAALGVERLFLLQLHARDPRVPFEDTLAALAELRRAGKVEHLGLCNTTPAEIRQALRHFPVAAVQNELGVMSRGSAEDGTLALAAELGLPFLAYRPLGGKDRVAKLAKNKVIAPIAERHGAGPAETALAVLLAAGDHVVPLVGATRPESMRSSLAAVRIRLDVSDRTAVEALLPFAPSPEAVAALRAPAIPAQVPRLPPDRGPGADPEVVVLMGVQGAGKSQLSAAYLAAGYERLNRDELGGKLEDLVPRLDALLAAGRTRVVLDNTYPTRLSRAPVIATALARGVPVRCRQVATPLPEARFNVALRMLRRYGRLLGPDEIKAAAKTDPNLPPAAAPAAWAACFEPPAADEGFGAVDVVPFVRTADPTHTVAALLLDVDGTLRRTRSGELYPRSPDDVELLPGRRETLAGWVAAGRRLFFVSNQSGISSGKLTMQQAAAAFLRTVELLGLPVDDVACCPHPAFPVGCWCRKPLPGLGVYLIERHRLARDRLIVVGDMTSDEEFAAGLGARYHTAEAFFAPEGPKPE